ncbi:hypothetical protein PIROE2DRAFT_14658, partial [Piromyces sp. E2]
FTGVVEAPDIKEYHYVSLDSTNNVIKEETIKRTYSDANVNINEVYNRTNPNVTFKDFPRPFKAMFKMGTEKYKPLPKNKIYNIYASCDPAQYSNIIDTPFDDEHTENKNRANCTVNIISPDSKFQSDSALHVIGFGSRKYKKLSFTFKLNKKFLGRKAIKLRAMANDVTLIREQLSSELFKAVGVPIIEGTYARVFINDEVFGLYSMTDSINDRWIGAYIHGNEKAKIGFSYKLVSSPPDGPFADLRNRGESFEKYKEHDYIVDEYEKKDIKPGDEQAEWNRLVQFVKLFEDWVLKYGNDQSDKAIEELSKFLNVESLIRLLVVESLVMALDNFWLSSSNVALYYNPERNKYQFIPYDFDESFYGPSPDSERIGPIEDCYHWADLRKEHYFIDNIINHPQVKKRFDVVMAIASKEIYNKNVFHPYIQSLLSLIKEDVEWNLNAINNIHTNYNGRIDKFTMEDFQKNTALNRPVSEEDDEPHDYKLTEFIDKRGDSCRAQTANVDTSVNKNISDDYDISETVNDPNGNGNGNSSSSAASPSKTFSSSFLCIFVPLLFLLLH